MWQGCRIMDNFDIFLVIAVNFVWRVGAVLCLLVVCFSGMLNFFLNINFFLYRYCEKKTKTQILRRGSGDVTVLPTRRSNEIFQTRSINLCRKSATSFNPSNQKWRKSCFFKKCLDFSWIICWILTLGPKIFKESVHRKKINCQIVCKNLIFFVQI